MYGIFLTIVIISAIVIAVLMIHFEAAAKPIQALESEKLLMMREDASRKIAELLKLARKQFAYKVRLAETYRTQQRQNVLYLKGKSTTTNKVSTHTKRLAADIYLIFNDKILSYIENPAAYNQLGEMGEALGLTWGGRWKIPFDPAHFELRKEKEVH